MLFCREFVWKEKLFNCIVVKYNVVLFKFRRIDLSLVLSLSFKILLKWKVNIIKMMIILLVDW